jgi:hypothetical protein
VDGHQLLAAVLWTGLAICIIGALAGVQLAWRGHRKIALAFLLTAALGMSAFSLIAGFSIGRFTAVVPALLAGYMVAVGRGWLITLAALVGALVIYIACSWVLTALLFQGGIFELIFGAWAIPLYAVAALMAFLWSLTHPVVRSHSPT